MEQSARSIDLWMRQGGDGTLSPPTNAHDERESLGLTIREFVRQLEYQPTDP